MRTDDIHWRSFEKSLLPEALFGHAITGTRSWSVANCLAAGNGVALGYSDGGQRQTEYYPPSLIVVEDRSASEIFSWLKTYAPETSPLSQFSRVVSLTDWERFGQDRHCTESHGRREDRWACVVLGEVLAQGENDVELSALPLSWGAGCFSTAVARAAIVHSNDEATSTCVERLRALESDRRFVRRPVSIIDLMPVWAVAGSEIDDVSDPQKVAHLTLTAALKHAGEGGAGLRARALSAFGQESGLSSDSIEQRVIGFQRLVVQLDEFRETSSPLWANVMVAAGAFLVGRGTSHNFLLRRIAKRWPSAFPWFGVMAALAGPRSWDRDWSRATKGAERLLRSRFDWCGVTSADLCWAEYSWLANTFTGNEVFGELPKMLPRVLSIEIVPGAACQLRLAIDAGGSQRETDRSNQAEIERRDRELRSTLEHVISLALRARHLIDGPPGQSTQGQRSLELGDPDERHPDSPRSRRTKRNSE